jgi:hypothetical protein
MDLQLATSSITKLKDVLFLVIYLQKNSTPVSVIFKNIKF